ncbi:MAG: deoxyuridine 5'-triphosphate nucleotidohydrolase [Clostridiales bacterium]|nr:deoxyuridine 5'-triphosphate nucleotidohydrolase [Clostridiales bacterium]
MTYIARFDRVTPEQYAKSGPALPPYGSLASVPLPHRATAGSAGYDFHTPVDVTLAPGESRIVPTSVRAIMDTGWVLMIFPRSGLGFKYGVHLANTVGVIDSDYANTPNGGHIMVKLTNPSAETVHLPAGERFCQGVFLPYGLAQEEEITAGRTGGLGSTGRE